MKLMIFNPDQKPLEFNAVDYYKVEAILRDTPALLGDSKWVTFKEDGETVEHTGQVDEMEARNYMEEQEQEFFCEKCGLETYVEFVEGDDVQMVLSEIAEKHHMRKYQCALKYGSSFIRVKAPGCSEEEWAQVTRKVKV
jgi:hypothetical protein